MMIPDILRNLFDMDYLHCPSVPTITNVEKAADLVSTVQKNDMDITSLSLPLQQQLQQQMTKEASATTTKVPRLVREHSPIIVSPSIIDCTPTTIETTTSTDDGNDDDDDTDTLETEYENCSTTSSNTTGTNRSSSNDSPFTTTATKSRLMTLAQSPNSTLPTRENQSTNIENHVNNVNQDRTHRVSPMKGRRRSNIATRLLFFPIQHQMFQKTTKSAVCVKSPEGDAFNSFDSKAVRRRRILRRDKRHRKPMATTALMETTTSTTYVGSNRCTAKCNDVG